MAGRPLLVSHPSSLEHDTGGHPEAAARITAIERELASREWLGFERLPSVPAERAVLEAVHSAAYIELVEHAVSSGVRHLDLDTLVSSGSFEAALHGAGGAVQLVDLLLDGSVPRGFSVHRPPGHHAERARAGGFCLFNNIAVAARYAVDRRGLERVLIFDWDVHHGNGTNDIFHASREVLFASIHQSPLYPGTGPASDIGSGEGTGFTVNMPVPPGADDGVFLSLVDHVVVPLAYAFEPQLVLVSAGFDAHRDDPLANCLMTENGFAAIAQSLVHASAELGVPLGAVLEGGYALGALARSVAATMEVMAGGAHNKPDTAEPDALALAARDRLARWWPTLAAA